MKKNAEPNYVGMVELEKIFGYSRQSFDNFKSEGLPSVQFGARAQYCTKEVHSYLVKRKLAEALKDQDHDVDPDAVMSSGSLQLERLRKARADKAELDLAIAKKEFMPRSEHEQDLKDIITHARKSFQMIGKELNYKLAQVTSAEDRIALIDKRVEEILEAMSKVEAVEEIEGEHA